VSNTAGESLGTSRTWLWTLVALTLVGAAVRSIALDSGLWIDEVYSLVRSIRSPISLILTQYWGDTHHPFYAVLAHVSRGIFGESAWSVRLPAAAFGVATIPLTAIMARRVVSAREALLAALLLAVSYHHVWFSQNARGYTAISCLTVVAMIMAMRGLDTGRRRFWAGYAVAAALGAYTHLTMIFVVVGHALAVAIELTRRGRRASVPATAWTGPLLGFAGAAILTLICYAPMLPQIIAFFRETRSTLQAVSTPSWAAVEMLRVLALGLSGGVAALGAAVLAIGMAIGLAGVWSIWRRSPLFLLLLAAPIVTTLGGAAIARGTLYPRFFFFAIAPVLVIAIHGTFAATAWLLARLDAASRAVPFATALSGAVVVLSVATLPLNYRYPKQDYAGAMAFVLAARAPADLVASTGVPDDPYRTLYGQNWPNVTTADELNKLRSGRRVWVLSTFTRYIAAKTPDLAQVLATECSETRVFRGTVSGGDIEVCALQPR
jgi:uncharacterized membrane protein